MKPAEPEENQGGSKEQLNNTGTITNETIFNIAKGGVVNNSDIPILIAAKPSARCCGHSLKLTPNMGPTLDKY